MLLVRDASPLAPRSMTSTTTAVPKRHEMRGVPSFVVPDIAGRVHTLLRKHADIDAAGVRFRDPFVRSVWFSLATGYTRWRRTSGLTCGELDGRVMVLDPGGDVYAVARGSGGWGPVRIEGDVLFPTDVDNYLAVIYHVRRHGARTDFGAIYIKGNESYLQVNPHRDLNVGRTLYPEYHVPLRGEAAIQTGRWQRFKVEVAGPDCHFYVGDMTTPQLTFGLLELDAGGVGLQPRSVGGPVWVDNVRVARIDRLAYSGPPRPAELSYSSSDLLTNWLAIGPLDRTDDDIARRPGDRRLSWHPFPTDARGAVVTGKIVDYHGPRSVAYFRTRVNATTSAPATLHVSTVDDLALWVNGRFHWFIPRGTAAWYDFSTNPAHRGQRIPIPLAAGVNEIVLRVRGGVYASGGFFARMEVGG